MSVIDSVTTANDEIDAVPAVRATNGSELAEAVALAFSAEGALARADARYMQRDVQLQFALAVVDAIDKRHVLVAEAGTGVGKTFAYLVPTLLSGARTLISTATKSLQDQLYLRDLPRLRDALQVPVTIALLKGRASYLCLHRMMSARQTAELPDRWSVRTLAKVETWAKGTISGDLAEMDGLDERSPVIPLVTSTRENCLGSECPEYRQCHVMKARRDAMAADLVVVNHHLFFADMTLRDSGVAELLPSVEVAVFDEAHQLAEAGVQFLGSTLSSGQIIDFARDMLGLGLQQARGLGDWQALQAQCDKAARELRLASAGALNDVKGTIKLRWDERSEHAAFNEALHAVEAACSAAAEALEAVGESSPDLAKLDERAAQLARQSAKFRLPAADGRVRWIDVTTHQARLVESPLDVRDAMREQVEGASRAWVFTSATLGDDEKMSWFSESAGLTDANVLKVGSPFNYPEHARLYIPSAFPRPNEPDHALAVARLAGRCSRALGGRTFVLTTTLRTMQTIGDRLKAGFEVGGDDIQVLVQGAIPKRQLIEQFLRQPRSVLVGSQSFWEGIDVPGEALQCVIIDKLPFPPPNDPLVQARVKRLEADGRNAFADYFVAEAAVSLKQGAGRLIRSETDRGLLVICDPRMANMNYGKRLQTALPPMTRVMHEGDALDFLAMLNNERAEP